MGTLDPRIELIPRRAAVCSDATVTLDVLVRVLAPTPELHRPRPPINLALVLDRSGSMSGARKMDYALQAACFAVEQLSPTDRVSVTTFDDAIEVVVPSTPAEDRDLICRRIRAIGPRGTTDLHGGWAEGARQVEAHARPDALNRVLLLTDGLANRGVTDPNAITAAAAESARRGVNTTTMGVGDDFNEDLLEAMAEAGDGNYYYIESPVMLADIFQTELQGLSATVGQKVSLGLEPGEGASVSDVLNDFERLPTGRLKLPNLVAGLPLPGFVRLTLKPRPDGQAPATALAIRLAWDPPSGGPRRSLHAQLELPAVPRAEWDALPEHTSVVEREALLMAARAQREVADAMAAGDLVRGRTQARYSHDILAAMPPSQAAAEAMAEMQELMAKVEAGENIGSAKLAKLLAYRHRKGKSGSS